MSIKPTVGRVLWFFPDPKKEDEVHAATIAKVNEDGTLNLSVVDSQGHQYSVRNAPLIQEDPGEIPSAAFAVWMPYQRGQAPASDAVQRRLDRLERLFEELTHSNLANIQQPPISNDHVADGCEQFQREDQQTLGQNSLGPSILADDAANAQRQQGDQNDSPNTSNTDAGDEHKESGDAGGAPAESAGEQGQGG